MEGLTRLAEHLTMLQVHDLQVRLQTGKVLRLQSSQQFVRAVPLDGPCIQHIGRIHLLACPLWLSKSYEAQLKANSFLVRHPDAESSYLSQSRHR